MFGYLFQSLNAIHTAGSRWLKTSWNFLVGEHPNIRERVDPEFTSVKVFESPKKRRPMNPQSGVWWNFYSSRQQLFHFRWIELTSQPNVSQGHVLGREFPPEDRMIPNLYLDVLDFPRVAVKPEVDPQLDSKILHFAMQNDVPPRFLLSAPFDQLLEAALHARWANEIQNLEFKFFREACEHVVLALIIRYYDGSFKVVFIKTNSTLMTKWFATKFTKVRNAAHAEKRLLGKTASAITVLDDRDW
jgi:hypothetical protein